MRSVTVFKDNLLDAVRHNRDAHVRKYDDALEAYRAKAIVELRAAADTAEAGGKVTTYFDLPKPESHARDYDRAIAMLEMHTQTMIELDAESYSKLVEDDWEWKRRFTQTTDTYLAG